MENLTGKPDCPICFGSGVMPYYHWVEPCSKCYPLTPEQEREGNIMFASIILISIILMIVYEVLK